MTKTEHEVVQRPDRARAMEAWERSARVTRERYERAVPKVLAASAGAIVTTVWALGGGGALAVGATCALATGAAYGWAWMARANTRARRGLREAYERWLRAETEIELARALIEALAAYERGADDGEQRSRATMARLLCEQARAAGAPVDDVVAAVETLEKLRAESGALAEEERELQAQADATRERIGRMAAEVERLAKREEELREQCARLEGTTSEPRGLYYPGRSVPASSLPVSSEGLRAEVAGAQRRAERGIAIESPVVGKILSEEARWSPYAPVHLTRELLELFGSGPASLPQAPAELKAEGAAREEAREERSGEGDRGKPSR